MVRFCKKVIRSRYNRLFSHTKQGDDASFIGLRIVSFQYGFFALVEVVAHRLLCF